MAPLAEATAGPVTDGLVLRGSGLCEAKGRVLCTLSRSGFYMPIMMMPPHAEKQEGLCNLTDLSGGLKRKGAKEVTALEARGVTVKYEGADDCALDGASITLESGSIHGLLGRNGAGKSTLMHCLLGLQRVDSGIVSRAPGLRTGWCAQKLVIDWFLGVEDNVLLGARLRGLWGKSAKRAVEEALESVGLEGKASAGPEELSGGEQQRLMIARVLAYAPDIYILDEPFVGLDAVVKDNLMSVLRERARGGASVLVSSHELDVLSEDMKDLTLLDAGKVVFGGTTEGFLRQFVPEDTIRFTLAAPPDPAVLSFLRRFRPSVDENSVEVRVDSSMRIGEMISHIATRSEIVDMSRSQPDLNDAIRAAYAIQDNDTREVERHGGGVH